jgi:UDP-N-acetylglucosamine--N-acetylmuramyl-(pentapeptide) pyrophosphoryl-undecaprenol N-acetylglucosamine transferase
MMMNKQKRIIISGGGTGGHIYPAISIANGLKEKFPDAEILFVGALGRMEMEKVPKAGYEIVGLPVIGLRRKLSLHTLKFVFRLVQSLIKARKIIKTFKPTLTIGVGGYASGPLLRVASKKGIPTLIQEQNSFPGITNKLLAKTVDKICVAYDGLERWFPKEKIVFTGNPVRQDIRNVETKKQEALNHFGFELDKPVLLVLGGSLGAKTINDSLTKDWKLLKNAGIQVLWQTGKTGYQKARESVPESEKSTQVREFIYKMDFAYAIADVVISRAGASTISELCLVKKPTIFVPSPNVAEDHQTKNATALKTIDAAMLIPDSEAREKLVPAALDLLKNENKRKTFSENMVKLARPNAVDEIVTYCTELMK